MWVLRAWQARLTPGGSVSAMSSDADSAIDVAAVDELRFLADLLRRLDAAAAAADWDGERAMAGVVAEARAELTAAHDAVGDVAAV